jgi:ABC-2 type transport system permease protein
MPNLTLAARQISRLFLLSWQVTLAYRMEFFLWLLVMSATPLLSLVIWHAIASSSPNLSAPDILTYYLLIIFIRTITSSWHGYEIIKHILNGSIVFYLIRPPIIYWELVTSFVARRLIQLFPLLAIVLSLFIFTPNLFHQNIFSSDKLLFFSISLILAAVISFTSDIALGLTAFWLEDAQELMAYRFLLTQVASGVMIPFYLMPDWLHTAFSFLPFRYTVSLPAEIMMGQVAGQNILKLIFIQFIWILIFIVILRVLYRRGLKKYAIPGQ